MIIKTNFGIKYDMFTIWRQSGVLKRRDNFSQLIISNTFSTGHLGQFNPISYKIVVEDSENYSF